MEVNENISSCRYPLPLFMAIEEFNTNASNKVNMMHLVLGILLQRKHFATPPGHIL